MYANREYIGDGLYVVAVRGMVKLCANDLEDPSDTVYLEPETYEALIRFADQLGWPRPALPSADHQEEQ
jgi:Holliday junction resolvase